MVNDSTPLKGVTSPVASSHISSLSEILLASITALATAGDVEKACRLAGQACVALRASDPAAARRFDVLLHRLTPKLTW
jgi:hypothetical protein